VRCVCLRCYIYLRSIYVVVARSICPALFVYVYVTGLRLSFPGLRSRYVRAGAHFAFALRLVLVCFLYRFRCGLFWLIICRIALRGYVFVLPRWAFVDCVGFIIVRFVYSTQLRCVCTFRCCTTRSRSFTERFVRRVAFSIPVVYVRCRCPPVYVVRCCRSFAFVAVGYPTLLRCSRLHCLVPVLRLPDSLRSPFTRFSRWLRLILIVVYVCCVLVVGYTFSISFTVAAVVTRLVLRLRLLHTLLYGLIRSLIWFVTFQLRFAFRCHYVPLHFVWLRLLPTLMLRRSFLDYLVPVPFTPLPSRLSLPHTFTRFTLPVTTPRLRFGLIPHSPHVPHCVTFVRLRLRLQLLTFTRTLVTVLVTFAVYHGYVLRWFGCCVTFSFPLRSVYIAYLTVCYLRSF